VEEYGIPIVVAKRWMDQDATW